MIALKLPPVMFPVTVTEDSVPRDVILGCAAVANVPVIAPETVTEDSVPRDVMLGCAAVVSVPATEVADTAPATERPVSVPSEVILG